MDVRFIESEFQRVCVGKGDVIILSYPGSLSRDAIGNIQKIAEQTFPGHKIIILEEGLKIGVVGASEVKGQNDKT